MKNKVVMIGLVSLAFASATFAQGVETDDMYFNSKDRAKLKAQQASDEAAYSASVKKVRKQEAAAEDEYLNPTDSYSSRNVNPEFAARSNSQVAQSDNQDYFVNNFQYSNASNLNRWNNNFSNWYGNPWYTPTSAYLGSSLYGWNSPYYGSYYDSWSNPYYRSGWSSSFSFGWGSPYNYGWNNYGYGYPYMNSWSSWGYGSSFGWGNSWYGGGGYGGYGYGYPSTVVVVNNGGGERGRNVVYGKRGSERGVIASNPRGSSNGRTRSEYVPSDNSGSTGGRSSYGGRVATTPSSTTSTMPTRGSQRQDDYYNRSWRNQSQSQQQSGISAPSRGSSNWNNSGSGNSNSGWNNNRSTGWGNSNNSNNSNSSNGGRSSSFEGGGSRSSAPASSGSNGRTRGRD